MAKTSAVEKNKRRRTTVANQAAKRAGLKAIIMNQALPIEERFKASIKLASLPRDGSKTRIRHVAKFRGVRAHITANCACRVLRCVNSAISARCRVSSSRAGKEQVT